MLSLFGIENSELEERLDSVDYQEMFADTWDYPLPSNLAKMVQGSGGEETHYYDNFAYPFLLENIDTKQILKLLKFRLWAEHAAKNCSLKHTKDGLSKGIAKDHCVHQIIKAEANLFETHGFELRDTNVVEPVKHSR